MFKNFSTDTKLFILCTAFVISVAVPIGALVMEKRIAIDFTRKELVGSRYLAVVREVSAAILSFRGEARDGLGRSSEGLIGKLAAAEAEAGAVLQTSELAQALAASLRTLWTSTAEDGDADRVLDALQKVRGLAQRIGDDSNLTLDPDLPSYYIQSIVVYLMPAFLARISDLQHAFEESVETALPLRPREVRLPVLASLLRATASEIEAGIAAAQRGDPHGNLDPAIAVRIAATVSHMNSYLGALQVSTAGIDGRDTQAYDRFHAGTVENAIAVWADAQDQLDRLLRLRIDALVGRMQLGLALIGAFAALSFGVAALTRRHLVRPLQRLEAAASKVRETKDYGLRAEYTSRDEIGRVTVAFNDMLSELAAARERESAERAEFARATRLTAMGEMAASIAHEVNQPLAAIVASGNAGLRWLAHETPDLAKVHTVLQRIVRDGLRASEVVGSVRAMFKKELREREPIDVYVLIADVLSPLHGELQTAQISVQIAVSKGLPSVLADRVQLQQVLVNLIANAVDAMGPVRDRARELSIGARLVEADGVVLTVADTGSGIDPGIRERIFDPFFTTKASGMGLGLPICRSIVEAHGGRVWASPGSPHGTVFQLMLPACIAYGA